MKEAGEWKWLITIGFSTRNIHQFKYITKVTYKDGEWQKKVEKN